MASPPPSNGAIAPLPVLSTQVLGGIGIDKWGGIMLGSAVGFVLLLWSYWRLQKYLAGRGRMNSVSAGQLRLAAARGKVEDLELLSTLSDFNIDADLLGFTPLHAACVQGHAAAALWCLEHGADITKLKQDGWRDTVLHYAAGSGSVDTVQVLLAYGADPNQENALKSTPAEVAQRAGHTKLAKYLGSVVDGSTARPTKEQALRRFGTFSSGSEAGSDKLGKSGSGSPARTNGAAGAGLNGGQNGSAGAAQLAAVAENGLARGPSRAQKKAAKKQRKSEQAAVKRLVQRGWEGYGSPGTVPKRETKLFRVMAFLTQFLGATYLIWRALRTLRPGYGYFYSIPFWLAEFMAYCLSFCFIASLYNMIERPERRVCDMLAEEKFPHIDVFICTYSEPVEIVEPTTVAALNLNWPGHKLTINILDDGKRPEMARMVKRLAFQCRYMQREAGLVYVGRDKVKGVPHHAKAGNINSCLLKEGLGKGEFILVLDCDMIVEPDFLQKTVGHFYTQEKSSGQWVTKDKAAFIQTPQDFFNVDAADPMVHCARFFYGPMLQGRDGIGACPCCGTGVVFRRDVLVSIGGQAYGSITEDYNTAMTLMSAGMATMYLNERLVYGMAPDEIQDVMTQRLRWAMGALQILMKDNPLRLVGLTTVQSLLFFEAAAHHYLAISTIFMAIVPIVFLFTQVSPMVCAHLWEFTLVFGSWYLSNRIMMWWVHRGTEGGSQELWRGSQMWVWMAPNHIKAIWKVLVAENPIIKKLFNFEIGFAVTSKEKAQETRWTALKKALTVTWPHLTYYAAFAAGVLYFVVTAAMGDYSSWQIMVFCSAIAWGILIILCIWPPIWTMIPRVETELGWRIVWDPFADPATFGRTASRLRTSSSFRHSGEGVGGEKSTMLSGIWSTMSGALPSRLLRRNSRSLDRGRGSVDNRGRASFDRARVGGFAPFSRLSFAAGESRMMSVVPATIHEEGSAEAEAAAAPTAPVVPAAPKLPTWGAAEAPAQGDVPPGPAPNVRAVSFQTATSSVQSPMTSIFASQSGAPTKAASTVSPFATDAQAPAALSPLAAAANQPFAAAAFAGGPPQASTFAVDVYDQSMSLGTSSGGARRRSIGAFSNIGRVAMPRRTAAALQQSALLTSLILPERLPGQSATSILLDAHGNAAPGGGIGALAEQSVQLSAAFGAGSASHDAGSGAVSGSAGPMASVQLPVEQSLALGLLSQLTGADVSVVLPPGGSRGSAAALSGADLANVSILPGQLPTIAPVDAVRPYAESMRLDQITLGPLIIPSPRQPGASPRLPGSSPRVTVSRVSSARLQEVDDSASNANLSAIIESGEGSPVQQQAPEQAQRPSDKEAAYAATAASAHSGDLPPTQRSHGAAVVAAVRAARAAQAGPGTVAYGTESPSGRSARGVRRASHATTTTISEEEEADEAALADELASEEAEYRNGAVPLAPRVAEISMQLMQIAASLSPANASMLLDGNASMVIPVIPQSIYEHTLAARPNFRNREAPGTSYMFLIVNGLLLASLIAGSVLDVKFNTSSTDIGGAIGVLG